VLPREELAAALTAHDVLAVPSRWYDNSPNVILEAFSAGLPVVAANHGGLAGMVRHDVDGLLFRPGDTQSLSAALQRLASDPALLERLREGICPPHGIDGEMEPEELMLDELFAHRAGAST
jgi:glycosyltransferase involved in cell wall biosynthesis